MPKGKTKTIIWDINGIIADTVPYHLKAWQDIFQKRGVKFTEEDFSRHFGQSDDTIIRTTLDKRTSPSQIYVIASEKDANYRRRVMQNVRPLPRTVKLIKSLKGRGCSIALASSTPVENIQLVVRELDIEGFFQAIISGRDVKKRKPSPQGFWLAALKLGAEPENCIITEDAVAGVSAAKRSGMHCLAITNTHPNSKRDEIDNQSLNKM